MIAAESGRHATYIVSTFIAGATRPGWTEIGGGVLMVPLAPSDHNDPTRCRPIGCYLAAKHLADRYKEDR